MRQSVTQQVAENIGTALRTEEVLNVFGDLLLNARFADFFRPIVRAALAEVLDLEPEQIGPELVDEGVQQGITAGYLAKKWLEERIPQMVGELRQKFAEQYGGFENEEVAEQIARNFLIVRDEEMILGKAVSDGLLKKKE